MNPEENNQSAKDLAVLCRKLSEARAAFHANDLKQSGHNAFAKYDYFELKDFMPHALRAFAGVGLCGVVSFTKEHASLTIVDTESGHSMMVTSPMADAEVKGCTPVQNLGAAETYQRRYLWSAAMELTEQDIVNKGEPAESKAPVPAPVADRLQWPAKPQQPQQQALPGAEPEWQTWKSVTVGAYKANERNGRIYTNITFTDGRQALTTAEEIASIVSVAHESKALMDVKVKRGQKGAKSWWWLEDIQEHEEDTDEVPA